MTTQGAGVAIDADGPWWRDAFQQAVQANVFSVSHYCKAMTMPSSQTSRTTPVIVMTGWTFPASASAWARDPASQPANLVISVR